MENIYVFQDYYLEINNYLPVMGSIGEDGFLTVSQNKILYDVNDINGGSGIGYGEKIGFNSFEKGIKRIVSKFFYGDRGGDGEGDGYGYGYGFRLGDGFGCGYGTKYGNGCGFDSETKNDVFARLMYRDCKKCDCW